MKVSWLLMNFRPSDGHTFRSAFPRVQVVECNNVVPFDMQEASTEIEQAQCWRFLEKLTQKTSKNVVRMREKRARS